MTILEQKTSCHGSNEHIKHIGGDSGRESNDDGLALSDACSTMTGMVTAPVDVSASDVFQLTNHRKAKKTKRRGGLAANSNPEAAMVTSRTSGEVQLEKNKNPDRPKKEPVSTPAESESSSSCSIASLPTTSSGGGSSRSSTISSASVAIDDHDSAPTQSSLSSATSSGFCDGTDDYDEVIDNSPQFMSFLNDAIAQSQPQPPPMCCSIPMAHASFVMVPTMMMMPPEPHRQFKLNEQVHMYPGTCQGYDQYQYFTHQRSMKKNKRGYNKNYQNQHAKNSVTDNSVIPIPNLNNPVLKQCFEQQVFLYRIVYEQEYAAYTAIKAATELKIQQQQQAPSPAAQIPMTVLPDGCVPHQHLGLPPILLPSRLMFATSEEYQKEILAKRGICEEKFFKMIKNYYVRKATGKVKKSDEIQVAVEEQDEKVDIVDVKEESEVEIDCEKDAEKDSGIVSTPALSTTSSVESSVVEKECLDIRADFCKKIRELALKSEDISPSHLCSTESLTSTTPPLLLPATGPPSPISDSIPSLSSPPAKDKSGASAVVGSTGRQNRKTKNRRRNQLAENHPPSPPDSDGIPNFCSPPSKDSSKALSTAAAKAGVSTPPVPVRKQLDDEQKEFFCSLLTETGPVRRSSESGSPSAKQFCIGDEHFPPISGNQIKSEKTTKKKNEGENDASSPLPANGGSPRCADSRNYSSVVSSGTVAPLTKSANHKQSAAATYPASGVKTTVNGHLATGTKATAHRAGVHEVVGAGQVDKNYERLSDEVYTHYTANAQKQLLLSKKLRLRDQLYYMLINIFPCCGLYIVGSSLNGFGTLHSDMDLCLVITNREVDQKTDALKILYHVEAAFKQNHDIIDEKGTFLIHAKVPILRIKFHAPYADLTVDLNANNSVAIKNTHLLAYYSFYDWRVAPLVSVVKHWARCCGMNDAAKQTFTSYSLVLMVIHYLQVKVEILPSLQKVYPSRFSEKNDIRTLNIAIPLDSQPRNVDMTLAQLLIGFFDYFGRIFDFTNEIISVRHGDVTPRSKMSPKAIQQWSHVFIEEPFTHLNTAHSVFDARVFDRIHEKFIEAHTILTKDYSLTELFKVKSIHEQQ